MVKEKKAKRKASAKAINKGEDMKKRRPQKDPSTYALKRENEMLYIGQIQAIRFELEVINRQLRQFNELARRMEFEGVPIKRSQQVVKLQERRRQLCKRILQFTKKNLKSTQLFPACGNSFFGSYEKPDRQRIALAQVGLPLFPPGVQMLYSARLLSQLADPSAGGPSCPIEIGCVDRLNTNVLTAGYVDDSGEVHVPSSNSSIEWSFKDEFDYGVASLEAVLVNASRSNDADYLGMAFQVVWELPKPECDAKLTCYINVSHELQFTNLANYGAFASSIVCCIMESPIGAQYSYPNNHVINESWQLDQGEYDSGPKTLVMTTWVKKDAIVLVLLIHLVNLACINGGVIIRGRLETNHVVVRTPLLQYKLEPL